MISLSQEWIETARQEDLKGGRDSNEATRTGLEPATSGSTVRGSNQLSYRAGGIGIIAEMA